MAPPMQTPVRETGRIRSWLTRETADSAFQARLQRLYFSWLQFRSQPLALVGLTILAVLVAVAVLAPWLAGHDPLLQNLDQRLLPPSAEHWFGTDELGRSIFSRVVYGSRLSIYVVLLVSAITAPIGLTIGAVSGYLGGKTDSVLMRITDVFLAFPGLILALAFVAVLGPGLENAIIAIALQGWPGLARLARAETLVIRRGDFIAATRLQGASHARIIFHHVMPLCLPSVIVRMTLGMSSILLTAAGLGFLGLGAQPPAPEWGAMLSTGRRFIMDHWWLAAAPGTAILIISLAFNLFGDGLRDVLDPRSDHS